MDWLRRYTKRLRCSHKSQLPVQNARILDSYGSFGMYRCTGGWPIPAHCGLRIGLRETGYSILAGVARMGFEDVWNSVLDFAFMRYEAASDSPFPKME